MKILITNNHLMNYEGSETWVISMFYELSRLGHKVDVFTFNLGESGNSIGAKTKINASSYDLILVNHNTCLKYLLEKNIQGPKIYTCHGTASGLETPEHGADFYVAVSEEIKQYTENMGFSAFVIRNGINRQIFKPTYFVNTGRIVSLGKTVQAEKFAEKVAEYMGFRFAWITNQTPEQVATEIQNADAVLTYGRGAMETISCGRLAYIYDERPYQPAWSDGLVTYENWAMLASCNFSGRKYKMEVTPLQVAQSLTRAIEQQEYAKMEMVARFFDITSTAKSYLSLKLFV